MVIGGSEIYALFLPIADCLYLTRVHADVEGDAHLPDIDAKDWRLESDERREADENNEHDFSFRVYSRATM